MGRKGLYIIIFFLFAEITLILPAYSQNVPTPQPKLCCGSWDANGNCIGTLMTPEEYSKYCRKAPPSPSEHKGLSPSQQMQLQMFQGIMQPFFNSLFHFNNLFSPPSQDISYQQKEHEILKKQPEKAWENYLKKAEEQARNEALARQKAGQDILSQVRIGSGPMGSYTIINTKSSERETLTSINWDSPRARANMSEPESTEMAKEQLLRMAYFSKMADTFLQSGDLEAARFYAGLAFEGGANSPRVIEYRPPKELLDAMDSKKAAELNKHLAKYSTFYRLAMPSFENLQTIFTELEQIKTKKKESEKKIKEIETQIKVIEAKKQIAETPEEKVEADDLRAKALSLKQQAEAEYQDALQNEQRLLSEKQEIENKIKIIKDKIQVIVKEANNGGVKK